MDSKSEKRTYPTKASEYTLLEEIGHGLNAIVYRAICRPYNSIVAVKCLDLEKHECNLDTIYQEAQMMSLLDHPNVMRAHCSFIVDHFLWVVMPYMDGGSCLHIMKASAPDGLDEFVIATILKETLKGINYLHQQGHIHRDVKAGNILVDSNGAVKLGDFGVSACLFGRGRRQRSRNTIVGTPCWMAPEVMEQKYGYDTRADIWSFGITALELAHGHAPFSKQPPMKVLLMTLQKPPPGLDSERGKHFSKGFKDIVKMCLVKEPSGRPTAEKLLKHAFFKQAKAKEYIVQKILHGMSPLWERENMLREKDAARVAQRITPYLEQEEQSRNEYRRGVSCWCFDLEDVKAQAALIQEEDDFPSIKEEGPVSGACSGKDNDSSLKTSIQSSPPLNNGVKQQMNALQQLTVNSRHFGPGQWSSGKKGPKQIGRFDVFDGDLELESPGWHEIVRHRKHFEDQQKVEKLESIPEDKGSTHGMFHGWQEIQKSSSAHLIVNQTSDASTSNQRFQELPDPSTMNDCSVKEPLIVATSDPQYARSSIGLPNPAIAGKDIFEDKGASMHRKGRFSVKSTITKPSETRELIKSASAGDSAILTKQDQIITSQSSLSSSVSSDGLVVPVSVVVPQLKNLLLQIEYQHEGILGMLKAISPNESLNDGSLHSLASSYSYRRPNGDAEQLLAACIRYHGSTTMTIKFMSCKTRLQTLQMN